MRDHLRRLLLSLLAVVVVLQARPANAQPLDERLRSDVRKLLEITGAAQMGVQTAQLVSAQILGGLKKAQPGIPARALDVAQQVLDEEFARAFGGPDGLDEAMISIYARHFTSADIRGLLEFYGTDLGKKTIALMPVVFQEGAAAGRQWADRQMPRIAETLERRLRAEGFIK